MRIKQFLNSISSTKVNSYASFPIGDNLIKQSSNNNLKFQYNSNKYQSKSIICHSGLETVSPSYTRKRNQPYKIVYAVCNHQGGRGGGEGKNCVDYDGHYGYMRKGEGSLSIWESRRNKAKQQRYYQREYQRHTYQSNSNTIDSDSKQLHNFLKEVAANKIKHKFCNFFKIKCCDGKCKLECFNDKFQQFLKKSNLYILKGFNKINNKQENLDDDIKAQIMKILQTNQNNKYTQQTINKINEIVKKRYGNKKKLLQKYQIWAQAMNKILFTLGKCTKKYSNIQGFNHINQKQDNLIQQKLSQQKTYKLKQQAIKQKRNKLQQLNKTSLAQYSQQTTKNQNNYDSSKQIQGNKLQKNSEGKKKRKIRHRNNNISQQINQLQLQNTKNEHPSLLTTSHLPTNPPNHHKNINGTAFSTNHKKIRKQHPLAKIKYKIYHLPLRKKNIKYHSSHHNHDNINYYQIQAKNQQIINQQNYQNQKQNLQQVQILSSPPSSTLIKIDESELQQQKNTLYSKNYRNIRTHKLLQFPEQQQNHKKIIKKIKLSNSSINKKSILSLSNNIFQQLQQYQNNQQQNCNQSNKSNDKYLKNIKSNKIVKNDLQSIKSLKQMLLKTIKQPSQPPQILQQNPSTTQNPPQQQPQPPSLKSLHKILTKFSPIPPPPPSLIQNIQQYLTQIGLSFSIIAEDDSLLTQKRKIIYLTSLIKSSFINNHVHELEQYIRFFGEKGNIQWLLMRLENSISFNNISHQSTNTILTEQQLSTLLQKYNILKFYDLKYQQIIYNKQLLSYRHNGVQNNSKQKQYKITNQQQLQNYKLIGQWQMYITYKQKIPFDFYHYWNLGHILNYYQFRKGKASKFGNVYDGFTQKPVLEMEKENIQRKLIGQ